MLFHVEAVLDACRSAPREIGVALVEQGHDHVTKGLEVIAPAQGFIDGRRVFETREYPLKAF